MQTKIPKFKARATKKNLVRHKYRYLYETIISISVSTYGWPPSKYTPISYIWPRVAMIRVPFTLEYIVCSWAVVRARVYTIGLLYSSDRHPESDFSSGLEAKKISI